MTARRNPLTISRVDIAGSDREAKERDLVKSKEDPEDLFANIAMFHILLALADRERHGYDIMREVDERTEGKVQLGPGTLYGSIKRMLQAG